MMRRAAFLQAGAGAMIVAALPRISARAAAAGIVEYPLTSAPLTFSPVAGMQFPGLAFNAAIPGPVIRIVHGQRLRARYTNHASEAATIHWHGMILPNAMDGVENITQPPVARGKSFTYEFTPDPPGTRWYHDHVSGGLTRGLLG